VAAPLCATNVRRVPGPLNPLMAENHRSVIVIGAGISALVCAYRLKTLGIDTLLIEKSDRPGGVIRSDLIDGCLIERGPNSMTGTADVLALVEELGIWDELVEGDPRAPAFIYFRGRLHSVPTGPGSLVTTKLLTIGGKLALLGEPLRKRRVSDEEESVAAFAARRLGPQIAERFVAPFVSGIYAGDSNKLSVQAAFPRLATLERDHGSLVRGAFALLTKKRKAKSDGNKAKKPKTKRLCSFKEGMAFLPKTLAAKMGEDLMMGCSGITVSAGGVSRKGGKPGTAKPQRTQSGAGECAIDERQAGGQFIVSFERSGRTEQFASDNVVIAAPAGAASGLVGPLSEQLGLLLGEIKYPQLAVVSLAYDEAALRGPLTGFGFLAVPGQGLNILGCVYSSSLFPGRAPAGKVLLNTFVGGALNPTLAGLEDSELAALVHRDLINALGAKAEPRVMAITRYERSIPQYNLGHAERVRKIDDLARSIPGLHLVGNYLHGVSTGDCIKEADRIARQIGINP
jgi:oxygen-dependent protoporphyrinogen oxidase